MNAKQKMDISKRLSQKGTDIPKIADQVMDNPDLIPGLIEGLMAPKGTLRYGYEKVLRVISEQRPDLVYPFFDTYVELLDNQNSFLKWGAILTIANLVAVDSENRFDKTFRKYYGFIAGPVMVSAANVIGGSAKIVSCRPDLAGRVTKEILTVEKADYQRHNAPSPECTNVAIGQAIDTFDQIYDSIANKKPVLLFVKRQRKNSRAAVVKKAEKFLKRHG